jgi:hypothetical protein
MVVERGVGFNVLLGIYTKQYSERHRNIAS